MVLRKKWNNYTNYDLILRAALRELFSEKGSIYPKKSVIFFFRRRGSTVLPHKSRLKPMPSHPQLNFFAR